jgi:phospholipid transport system substrate-binding protein
MIEAGRRRLLAVTLAGVAIAAVRPVAGRAADADPVAPVSELYHALEASMRAGHGTPFRQRFQQLAPVVDRVFDLNAILRTSVGPRWAGIAADEQSTLFAAFRRFTIATYVANFDRYEGERFEVAPTPREAAGRVIVQSRIIQNNGEPVRLDYVMRREDSQKDAAWRAVDVLIDGTISRVAVQRSDFRGVIVHGGAPALISSLRQRTADLSGGRLDS